jgi:large subunit ribosomal protein L10
LCEEQTLSLNRNEKAAVVTDVSAQAARSQTLALAEYRGLTVENLNKLRVDARAKGVYLHVLKNTLARRAVAGTPFEVAQGAMVGPLIYGFSEDAVAAAKVLSDFSKGNDKLIVKGGAYAGRALDANGVKALAAIPSREVLIAQVAGLLKSPIQRLAGVLAALAEKKGGGAEGDPPTRGLSRWRRLREHARDRALRGDSGCSRSRCRRRRAWRRAARA